MIRVDLLHNALVRARFATSCVTISERIQALITSNEQLSRKLISLRAKNEQVHTRWFDMAHPQEIPRLPEDIVPALIWVVDDDQDDQCLLQEALTHLDSPIATRYLNDGDELLPALALATVLPRLILMDLNMQRQGGLETLQALRAISAYHYVPVVILTTSDAQPDRDRSLQLGADGFLTKSVRQSDSVLMLKKLASDWQLTVH